MKEKIYIFKKSGFIEIIISNTIVKVLVFASSIFLPRFLSVRDFGIYTYTENIFNYFLIINGIGISNSILKFCSTNESKENHKTYWCYILKVGILFDIILFMIMLIFSLIYQFKFNMSNKIFMSMLCIPVFSFIFECVQLYLRSTFENAKYATLTFLYTFIFLILEIFLAIYLSIKGVILAKYISILLALILGIYFLYKTNYFTLKKNTLNIQKKIQILKYGFTMLIGNFASMIVTLNDTQILSNYINNPNTVALYKIGTLPLQIMLFFTNSIIIFILPIFVKHSDDPNWIKKNYKKTMIYNFLVCIFIHVCFFIFAKYFIMIFYGNEYYNSLPYIYRFLCVSFVLSTLRNIPGNLLSILGYEKYNLIVNIFTVILHIALQYIFMINLNIEGIGLALFISYLISGFLLFFKMNKIIHNKS